MSNAAKFPAIWLDKGAYYTWPDPLPETSTHDRLREHVFGPQSRRGHRMMNFLRAPWSHITKGSVLIKICAIRHLSGNKKIGYERRPKGANDHPKMQAPGNKCLLFRVTPLGY